MDCKICGMERHGLNLFKVHICRECFLEIANTSVLDKKYEENKNLVQILLSYYVSENYRLNPVN